MPHSFNHNFLNFILEDKDAMQRGILLITGTIRNVIEELYIIKDYLIGSLGGIGSLYK